MKPTLKNKWNIWASKENTDWENKKLGASATHIRRAPTEIESEINESLRRKKLIAIRLPQSLIDALKALAEVDAIGYQTYIRQILARHVQKRSTV